MAYTAVQFVNDAFNLYNEVGAVDKYDISKVMLRDEIAALKQELGQNNVHVFDGELTAVVGPIILRNPKDGELKDLGKFRIEIDTTAFDPDRHEMVDGVRVIAIDPVYPLDEEDGLEIDNIPHPNIEGDTLCFGVGERACEAALAQGRLFDFVMMIQTILNSVDDRTQGHQNISQWFEKACKCNDCGDSFDEKEMVKCNDCGESFCQNCKPSMCSGCEQKVCNNCGDFKECAACGKHKFCHACTDDSVRCRRCEKCDDTFCTTCFHTGNDGKVVKLKDRETCAVCREDFDVDHSADGEIKELKAVAKKLAKE